MADDQYRATVLTLDKSNVTTRANVPNVESEIIDVLVPRNFAYKVRFGTPLNLTLMTAEVFVGSGVIGQVLALAQRLPDSPSLGPGDEVVVTETVLGVEGAVNNYAAAYDPVNTITNAGIAWGLGNPVIVYHIWHSAAALDVVNIKLADANKEKFSPLMRRPLSAWHENSQYDTKTRQELRNEFVIAEKAHLLVYLTSDVVADFSAFSRAKLELKVLQAPVSAVPASDLVTFTEG